MDTLLGIYRTDAYIQLRSNTKILCKETLENIFFTILLLCQPLRSGYSPGNANRLKELNLNKSNNPTNNNIGRIELR